METVSLKGGEVGVMKDMSHEGVFWPVFLMLVGTAILMVNFGVLPPEAWKFWPMIFILMGLMKLVGIGVPHEK